MKLTNPSLHAKKVRAGRMGGMKTFERHGREHYVKAGLVGGRPRVDLDEILRQSTASLAEKNNEIEGGRTSNSLKKLKMLYALISHRSNGDKNNKEELASPQLTSSSGRCV